MSLMVLEGATALVTGASSGIGEAFARALAQKGVHLILTARSQDRLTQLADELRERHHISVHLFPMDLCLPDAAAQLMEKITASGLTVDLLINNAGFGRWTHFLGESIDGYEQMVALNINALVRLTYLCLPAMLARGSGGVINVASTAAFQPVSFLAIYAASKTFVLSFTEALAGEYRDTGIRILALCPGPTDTNFSAVARANTPDTHAATAAEVAEAGLAAFVRGRSYVVQGCRNYLTTLLPRILPRATVVGMVASMFKNKVRPSAA